MSSRFESSVEHLRDEDRCSRLTDRAERGQAVNLIAVWEGTHLISEGRLAIGLNLCDLAADEIIVTNNAFYVAAQKRRQPTTVTGHHRIEATLQPFVNSLAAEPNAVQGEQPLYPADNTSPLLN